MRNKDDDKLTLDEMIANANKEIVRSSNNKPEDDEKRFREKDYPKFIKNDDEFTK